MRNRIIYYCIILFVFNIISYPSYSRQDGDIKNNYEFKSNDLITTIDKINNSLLKLCDSVNIWWTSKSNVSYDTFNISKIPSYPVYVYEQRIKDLSNTSPIKLEYNDFVKYYIDAYGINNREKLSRIISLSSYYFPIFEECLAKYQLPIELKYVAAVESALDANAISSSGAVGLWQFIKSTSDIMNLKVSSYIDERRDVYLSTDAACRYMKYLYDIFKDWHLVLAAYNGGPGTVKKAIARSGGKTNYWELRPYFTQQMQNYVPAFIAMSYLMKYHAEHNIFPKEKFVEAYKTDTLQVTGPMYLKAIAEITNIDFQIIKKLNPIYLRDYIPSDNQSHTLVLPIEVTHLFLLNQNNIYKQQDSILLADKQENKIDSLVNTIMHKDPKIKNKIVYHQIAKGDNLYRLSLKYQCTIEDIFKWNNYKEDYVLRVGDKVKIMTE